MSTSTVVNLPTKQGEPFSFENLLKLNARNNWEQRFRKMVRDALNSQLQAAIGYYGKMLSGELPPEVSHDERHHRLIIHLDALAPQLAEQLLWVQAHRVPRSIIDRPEALVLRSPLADQLWAAAGVESHITETALNHYRSFCGIDDRAELYERMTAYRLGVELRNPNSEEHAVLDNLSGEAMLIPGTDYFYVNDDEEDDDATWLRAVLVGLLLK